MLLSPGHLNDLLESVLSFDGVSGDGVHTALLLMPHGQLLACATAAETSQADVASASGAPEGEEGEEQGNTEDTDSDDLDGEEEPYLERPERLRLLSGLASQWEEDESPRVECELGRLLLVPVHLPAAEALQANAPLPTLTPSNMSSLVLALNATSDTQWTDLTKQGTIFADKWRELVK